MMISEGYMRGRIEAILDQKKLAKASKIDAILTLMHEVHVDGRKDLASELRNLLQVKEEDREKWPYEE
jgi:hypothetical protein